MPNLNADEISSWKGRIQRGEAFQAKNHKAWRDAVDLYNCEFFQKNLGYDPERVEVNFANWYIDNLVALVYFRDPFIFVKSRNDKYTTFAETMEQVINYHWIEMGLKQENKRAIRSAFMMPPGWVKVGYTAELGQDVAKIDEIKEKGAIQLLKDAIKGVFSKEKKELTPEEQGHLNYFIKEENIFATWIPSWNIIMPEGYHVIEKMPWICEIEDVNMLDFLANPTYKNKTDLKSDRRIEPTNDGGREISKVGYADSDATNEDNDVIRLYHIWDRRGQRRMTLSMRSNEPHSEGKWPYDMEGFPYLPLAFDESLPTDQTSNPYPPNCLKSIMPQIIEKSNMRTQMTKWRKRASAFIMCQKGLLTEDDMQQITETEGLQVVNISNIQAVQMQQGPSLPNEVFAVEAAIDKDLQQGTSMGQMMFAPMPGQRTATQAGLAQQGMELHAQSRVDCIEDFTVREARCIAQLAWQFYDKKKVEEIIGMPVSENMWPTLPKEPKERRRVIQAELQFKIDAGSTAAPKDELVDRKQYLDALSIISSIAPGRLKEEEVVLGVLKKFKFNREVDRLVYTNDDEERVAAQQENQLLNSDVPQVVSPNENHKIHMEDHIKGGQPTQVMDIHLTDHGKFLGVSLTGDKSGSGSNTPQAGDKRPPMKSSNPEIVRQGNTSAGDINQSAQNLGAGTGAPERMT